MNYTINVMNLNFDIIALRNYNTYRRKSIFKNIVITELIRINRLCTEGHRKENFKLSEHVLHINNCPSKSTNHKIGRNVSQF